MAEWLNHNVNPLNLRTGDLDVVSDWDLMLSKTVLMDGHGRKGQ